jgi:hypothetical protein
MSQFIKGKLYHSFGDIGRTDFAGLLNFLGPKTLDEIQRNLESYEKDYKQTLHGLELFMLSARQEGLVDQNSDGEWILKSGL